MKFVIQNMGENIGVVREFTNPTGRGEIAHFICELELAKQILLEMWNEEETK